MERVLQPEKAQGLQNIVKQLLGSVRQGLPTPQLNILGEATGQRQGRERVAGRRSIIAATGRGSARAATARITAAVATFASAGAIDYFHGWEPGGGWAIAEPSGAGERLSNAAVIGGKGTANSGGCEASAAPSSRLRFCAPPGESGCPCRSLGSGATIDVLVPGIVRCSGNCKRIVQLRGCASAMRARPSTSSAKSVVGDVSASPPPNHWL